MEINMEVPQKTKNRTTIWSSNTTPRYMSEIYTPGYNRVIYTFMFIAALFTMAKLWEHPICPTTDKRIKKCSIYTQWSFIQP
jgi:hypothetical protein